MPVSDSRDSRSIDCSSRRWDRRLDGDTTATAYLASWMRTTGRGHASVGALGASRPSGSFFISFRPALSQLPLRTTKCANEHLWAPPVATSSRSYYQTLVRSSIRDWLLLAPTLAAIMPDCIACFASIRASNIIRENDARFISVAKMD